MTQGPTVAPVIVWFRQDLRLTDNPALAAALSKGRAVIPLYVLDETPGVRAPGGASLWWLDKSLAALDASLKAAGSRLILRQGNALTVLEDLRRETGADMVMWNRLYDAGAIARDKGIKAALNDEGVEATSHNGGLLNEPWEIRTGQDGPYRVFTPYWRAARAATRDLPAHPRPSEIPAPARWPRTERLVDWGLHPSAPDWSGGFDDWQPGEAGAKARLDDFLDGALSSYGEDRDRPDREGTSRLSPHLHFGEIGPRQVWRAMHLALAKGANSGQADKFLSELGWREFNHHLLFYNPDLPTENLKPEFNTMGWRDDAAGFAAWTKGLTGYPIVDAGMRELWATGFMHNRVRMIAGSFLIKDLLIDWRRGEAWFWDTLVDADMAQNSANWQWVAGSGADASPWFRVFNPVTQGEKFDPNGAYVRRWVPEIAGLPDAVIHAPWKASEVDLRRAGVIPGKTYPVPVVEHAGARLRALDAFKMLKDA